MSTLRNIDVYYEDDYPVQKTWTQIFNDFVYGMTDEDRELEDMYQRLSSEEKRFDRHGILGADYPLTNQNDDIFVVDAYVGSNA
mmetsp:Transcript_2186/g.2115  ORF Transcript_2186/g.2115 Transcript_2186/m.2115 type:complete len:84 (-) Transcript_2186:1021-1272(-)